MDMIFWPYVFDDFFLTIPVFSQNMATKTIWGIINVRSFFALNE